MPRAKGGPKTRRRHKKTMKAAKLSAKEREILASGDAARLREYLGKEQLKSSIIQAPSIIIQSTLKKKPG